MGRTPKERESYYIYCEGRWVECTEEVYRVYYQGKRSAKYQEEKDKKNGKVTFSEIEAERQLNIAETLADDSCIFRSARAASPPRLSTSTA